jgi:sugar lactone lactonase YvrE
MQFSKRSESVLSCALQRAFAALLICTALVCVAAPGARAGSDALWIADAGNQRVDEYLPTQIKSSGTPTPITIPIGSYDFGLCFDKSKNLWVTGEDGDILKLTASSLKKLPTAPSPAVTIGSPSFNFIWGCTFDKHGNLWVADHGNNSLDEISKAQLKTSSTSITPAVIITDTADALARPSFVTFDKSGNLWTDNGNGPDLLEFSRSQLSSTGSKTAAVVLMGGGSFGGPGQIGFDKHGNLWVANYSGEPVVMFSKSQLSASNNDAPAVTISSSSLDSAWTLAFNSGDLWVMDWTNGNAQEFSSSQLESGGTPAPPVVLTDAAAGTSYKDITFGPAYGK